MEVTIYSPDAPCQGCRLTKVQLDSKGVPYRSVTATDAQISAFKADGHLSFPVVVVDCGDEATWSWSGFRIDHIKRLISLSGAKDVAAA